ncbi:hypothetical protein GS896_27810 [Rhodococcus hoagii]|nr:hypothetical protein [Prescottella equi]MBM4654060.1 hypothetical protein [Prescottella equi]MBM4654203.1 hypothetical protein [Prescottella equi]MBM4719677.1 hypothetical protein [Prescottella equi]NKR23474.1 hypothetical protein [Prescottella equi]
MIKKLAGSVLASAAVTAAAAITPAAAAAAPSTVRTGDEILVMHPGETSADVCTVGFVFTGSDNKSRALTAGHCGNIHDEVATSDGRVIGRIADRTFTDGAQRQDTALVSFYPGIAVDPNVPDIGRAIDVLSSDEVEDLTRTDPVLCKLGAKTGLTCGSAVEFAGAPTTMLAFASNGGHGDSGAAVWTYGAGGEILAVGTVSGGPSGRNDITFVEPLTGYMDQWKLH